MRRTAIALAVAAALALAVAPEAGAKRAITTGIAANEYQSLHGATRDLWFDRTVQGNADLVRVDVIWRDVGSERPANPRDPADPAYDFSGGIPRPAVGGRSRRGAGDLQRAAELLLRRGKGGRSRQHGDQRGDDIVWGILPAAIGPDAVFFLRELFCLEGRQKLRPRPGCGRVQMDALGHHPISTQNPPTYSAIHPDDAAMSDIDRLRRVLRAAEKAGVVPGGRRPISATEFWWSDGVPMRRHARYVEQALYVLWKQRVQVAIHYFIRDHKPLQALFRPDGREKPASRAFRFPFVTERLGRKRVRAWGRSPQAGRVKIQRKKGGGWKTLKRIRVREDEVFTARLRGSKQMRARIEAREASCGRSPGRRSEENRGVRLGGGQLVRYPRSLTAGGLTGQSGASLGFRSRADIVNGTMRRNNDRAVANVRSEEARRGLEGGSLHELWAERFLVPSGQRRFFDRVFADLRTLIGAPPGTTVIDAGCGPGYHTVRLARNGWRVKAFDFSPAALALAEENVQLAGLRERVELHHDDLLDLSLETESAEYVVCWGVLMHIPDIARAVAELSRILAPRGKLVVSELNCRSPESIALRARARFTDTPFERGPAGWERWQVIGGQHILVRHADPSWLEREFGRHGVLLHKRVTGQLSEAFVYGGLVARLVNWLNYHLVWSLATRRLALSNVLVFAKS